ncbi:MAG: cbb3-type cytochrome oxidase assembly protein [Gemmataceae bacterium]
MSVAVGVIFGTIALMSLTVIIAFVWAAQTGQFESFQQGATSIFDEDEPVGEITDRFPYKS